MMMYDGHVDDSHEDDDHVEDVHVDDDHGMMVMHALCTCGSCM